MKLTLEQIKSVTYGALTVTEKPDEGFFFSRLSDSQLDAFDAIASRYRTRAMCTAGCRLDFHTDSEHLLVYANPGKYEIHVDGLPAALFECDVVKRCVLTLPKNDTRVTILLPNHSIGSLQMVYLDRDSYIRPHVYKRKFLFLGDSITQGVNSSHNSFCYVNRVSNFFDAEIRNWGVSGTGFNAQTLEATDYDPDVVFIAYGTNDYVSKKSIEGLELACKEYLDKVQSLFAGKKVICISPLWRVDNQLVRDAGTHVDCRNAIIRQIEAHGFYHIDGYTLVPHMEYFFADEFLHPNDIGFSYYTENLIKILTKEL